MHAALAGAKAMTSNRPETVAHTRTGATDHTDCDQSKLPAAAADHSGVFGDT
jgi:hypothetical protein